MGVFAGISTFVAFAMADPASRRMATDEMYTLIRHRAQRHALLALLRSISRIRGNYHDDGL